MKLFTRAILIALLYAACAALAYQTRITPEGGAYTLAYTDLPADWTLETTSDLETWHTVILAGELAPREIALTLSNKTRAQFYRIRTTEPTTP